MKRIFLGVFIALFGVSLAHAQTPAGSSKPTIRFCTAKAGGNYHWVGTKFAEHLGSDIDVQVVPTRGSWENLELINAGRCDFAIVQNDAMHVYRKRHPQTSLTVVRAGPLYKEYVHVLCNRKSGIDDIDDLEPRHKIAVGDLGTGSSVTWDGFTLARPEQYGKVQISPMDGVLALTAISDGAEVQCMLFTAGLNSEFVSLDANNAGDYVKLITAKDSKLRQQKDDQGRPLYETGTIPGGKYKKLQSGFWGSSVETMTVEALLLANKQWVEANTALYTKVVRARDKLRPEMLQKVGN